MKRAQVRDAIGWMLVAADRYPGLSVRTRNGWRPGSSLDWGRARAPGAPSLRAGRQAAGGGENQRKPPRSPLLPLGTATFSLKHSLFRLSTKLVQSYNSTWKVPRFLTRHFDIFDESSNLRASTFHLFTF